MSTWSCLRRLGGLAVLTVSMSPGLAGAGVTPGYLPVNHQRIVPRPLPEVWSRLHEFLQDQGYAVRSETLAGGVIDAVRATPGKSGLSGVADCPGRLFWRTAEVRIALTILVKPAYDGTKVTVNTTFLDVGRPNRKGAPGFGCTSNGVLESAVLDVASGQPMESAAIPR